MLNRLLHVASAAIVAAIFLIAAPALAQMQGGPVQNGVPLFPGIFGAADPLTGIYFGTNRFGIAGHVESSNKSPGTGPALSACGTSPILGAGSSDAAGTVTMGTATPTGCVITFGVAYITAPTCVLVWQGTPLAAQNYTISTTAITLVQTATSSNVVDYICVAKSGG